MFYITFADSITKKLRGRLLCDEVFPHKDIENNIMLNQITGADEIVKKLLSIMKDEYFQETGVHSYKNDITIYNIKNMFDNCSTEEVFNFIEFYVDSLNCVTFNNCLTIDIKPCSIVFGGHSGSPAVDLSKLIELLKIYI